MLSKVIFSDPVLSKTFERIVYFPKKICLVLDEDTYKIWVPIAWKLWKVYSNPLVHPFRYNVYMNVFRYHMTPPLVKHLRFQVMEIGGVMCCRKKIVVLNVSCTRGYNASFLYLSLCEL